MADGTSSPASPLNDALADGAGAGPPPLAERRIEALEELAGIGLDIARAIQRQVNGPEPQTIADLNAAAMAYARVARAVRQTVMLQDRLRTERNAAASRAAQIRARVAGIVRRAIEDGGGDAEQVERLAAEAAERLEQERFDDDMARPVREIVADICRDLGLHPDWPALADEIAAAEAFARGEAGDAAADAEEDDPEYIDVCWIGDDGKPFPVARMRTRPNTDLFDPSKDPRLRRDSS